MKVVHIASLLALALSGCASTKTPTVAIVLSPFSPIAASLSQAQSADARASISAELASSGFKISRDRAVADYVAFVRCKIDEDSPSRLRPVIVFMKENPKPYLPPMPPLKSGVAGLAEDAAIVDREVRQAGLTPQ